MIDIVVENKYVLIYDGLTLKSGTLTTGNVTSPYSVEPFNTAQELVDRGLELGLTCGAKYMVQAMEHGAVFPQEYMDYLMSIVWDSPEPVKRRMEALGYPRPKPPIYTPQ